MRRLQDAQGRDWTLTLGRASWGVFRILFVPDGGGGTRQVDLDAASAPEAERRLTRLSDEELHELLEDSRPRDP